MSATDRDLHGRWVREKDSDAFAALVRAHGAMVYATCRRVLGDPTEAEDLTQECFWKFARETATVRSVGAWLHTVATRLCISKLRSEGRRQARERQYSDGPAKSGAEPGWSEVVAWVDEAIGRLPEESREVLVRHYFEGATHARLAEDLNVAPSTVTRRIQRGVERIREELSRKGVTVSVAVLITGLASDADVVLPSSAQASLVKIGLGIGETTATAAATSSGLSWAAGAAIAGLVALALAVGAIARRSTQDTISFQAAPSPPFASVANRDPAPEVSPLVIPDAPPALIEMETEASASIKSGGGAAAEEVKVSDEPEPKTMSLSGRVLDLRGFPIAGAMVSVTRDISLQLNYSVSAWSGTTNRDGRYRIEGLPPEKILRVNASASGFRDINVGTKLSDTAANDVDLTLREGVPLHGRVLSVTGQAVPGALVRTVGFILEDTQGSRSGGHGGIVITDANGRFHLGFSTPGFVILRVASEEFGQFMFADVPVGGDGEQILTLKETAEIYGRITDGAGTPVEGVQVEAKGEFAMSREDSTGEPATVSGLFYRAVAYTDAAGKYHLSKLPSGIDYTVRVRGNSGSGPANALSDAASLGTFPPGARREWNYEIHAGLRIRGMIVGEQTGNIVKNSKAAYYAEGSDEPTEVYASDGSFDVTVYAPARYFVFPKLYMPAVDDSVERGTWIPWAPGDPVDIVLHVPEPFSIGSRVVDVDGAPIPEARIQVGKRANDTTSYFFDSVVSDSDGRYRFAYCLPGGEHWFVASKTGFVSSTTTPILGDPGMIYPEEVTVLRRAGGLTGVLRCDDGQIVYGMDVSIAVLAGAEHSITSLADTSGVSLTVTTDENGYFSTGKRLPEGILDLAIITRLSKDIAYETQLIGVEIAPGRYINFDTITLTKKGK